jgi:hypothetical protein
MDKESQDVELLLSQYKILSEDIRSVEAMSEKVLGVGFTLISALIVYCLKESIREIYFASTPAYLGLLLFMSSQYNTVFWKGGHKRSIEIQINIITGRNTLIWEELAEHGRKRFTFQNAMFGAFLLLSLLVVFLFSLTRIWTYFGFSPAIAYGMISVVLFFSLVLSILDGAKKFEESKRASLAIFGANAISEN